MVLRTFAVFVLLSMFGLAVVSPPTTHTGTVVDKTGPVAGARVRVQGQYTWTTTNPKGLFKLKSEDESKPITAWKPGYAIAALLPQNRSLKLTLQRLPTEDNSNYKWVSPIPSATAKNNCGNCHRQIYDEWQRSRHAHSASNKHLLNLFAGTDWHGREMPDWNVRKENELGAGVCANCHAPTFRDPTLEYDLTAAKGVDRHGVHCDYCHKIIAAPTDKLGTRFGKDGYDLLRPPRGEQLNFGPLEDAVRTGEQFGHSPIYQESRYCASCHEGVIFGVHVYGTYSEWQQSPAKKRGQQCQSCHMTPTGTMTNIAPGHGGIPRNPSTLASHHLPGRSVEMLRKCLPMTVTSQSVKTGVRIEVTITPTNVGHRVPTGFVDRNLILVVESVQKTGQNGVLLSGSRLSELAGKELQGRPGTIYAKQISGTQGEQPHPFWLPIGKVIDTRLVPEQADRQAFVFASGITQVRVRLLYRRFWHQVAQARQWPENETVVWDQVVRVRAEP